MERACEAYAVDVTVVACLVAYVVWLIYVELLNSDCNLAAESITNCSTLYNTLGDDDCIFARSCNLLVKCHCQHFALNSIGGVCDNLFCSVCYNNCSRSLGSNNLFVECNLDSAE